MDKEILILAVGATRDQAQQRAMTAAELVSYVSVVAHGFESIVQGPPVPAEQPTLGQGIIDPKAAIKEKSVTCLECGKSFKVLTKKHLLSHGLTPEAYREKYGYKKGAALCAKSLVRERRKKMQDMKLWERRGKKAE